MASKRLPSPVPASRRYCRFPEAGSEERQYIGLDRNVRVSPFPDWFMENIRQGVDSELLNNYPVQDKLEIKLADSVGLPKDRLLITPSSDAAFQYIYHAYVRPGDKVVMLDPSYAMFRVYADMHEAEAILIPFDLDLRIDTERLLNSMVPGTRMAIIANSNQPTGTLLGEDVLEELIKRATAVDALVVIDEAYYPFSHTTAVPWVETYPNLLVTRTFSKAGGLAGCRIGFVAGHPQVINELHKVRTVNDMTSMSVLCASQLLQHPEVVNDYVTETEDGGRLLEQQVRDMGLEPLPTHANFMLIRVGQRCDPAELVDALKGHGYLIKGFLPQPVSDCIRVTLGPPQLMSNFADALGKALDEVRHG